MKPLILLALFSTMFVTQTAYARTVEIDVQGMTCAFCVDALERKFGEIKSISKVEISLKLKKVRLETAENLPTVETIKQIVLDSGFMPTKIAVSSDAEKQE